MSKVRIADLKAHLSEHLCLRLRQFGPTACRCSSRIARRGDRLPGYIGSATARVAASKSAGP